MTFTPLSINRLRPTTVRAAAWGMSSGLGLLSGSAFAWAAIDRAWAIYIGGFFSTLAIAVCTMVLLSIRERLHRGEWRRGIFLGCATMLPLTTLYLGVAALISSVVPLDRIPLPSGTLIASKPILLNIAPSFYTASLAMGLGLGLLYVRTSPFKLSYRILRRQRKSPANRARSALLYPRSLMRVDPYQIGCGYVLTLNVREGEYGAPVPMQIHTPQEPGTYPVVLFLHGFMLVNAYFSTVLRHLASHGFVVVAPQMYEPEGSPLGKPGTLHEASLAMQLLNWLPDHLDTLTGVNCDLERLGIAGHSRGGKVAWLMLKEDPTCAVAFAGIDPVDGAGGPLGSEPRALPDSVAFPWPALIVGTGLGQVVPSPFSSACAPKGDNHEQFFAACAARTWHVFVRDHGHLDMLDAHTPRCRWRCGVCLRGKHPERMRQAIGGLLAAFFMGSLQGNQNAYRYLRPHLAPLPVQIKSK